MAGLSRYTQQQFGINATANQMAQYGSFLTTPMLYDGATITPAIIQSLANFQAGLYAALGGSYSPTIQDQNSLFFLAFYQLSYLLTRGIAEWDVGTTYNTNDFCKVGNVLYYSLEDGNIGNVPAGSPADWQTFSPLPISPTQQTFISGSGTYITPSPAPLYLRVRGCGGGGGGGGSGTGGGNGGSGAITIFGNVSDAVGYPGVGGSGGYATDGGAGGTATTGGLGFGLTFSGQNGGDGMAISSPAISGSFGGGSGGNSLFNGAGQAKAATTGGSATPNTGSGGGSGGQIFTLSSPAVGPGGGGGAGWFDIIIPNPLSSYGYQIGSGGAGGTAGTGGNPGGPGASGIVIVTQCYQ